MQSSSRGFRGEGHNASLGLRVLGYVFTML